VVTTLSDADFAALARYLSVEAGLVFDASRRPGLTSVLSDRFAETGIASVPEYLSFVSGDSEAATEERQALLDGVTIQETHFYRNGAQVDALRTTLLPDLLARAAVERRDLRVWSAGCSTGEEPYTLSMLVHEVAALHQIDVRARILGTDVSQAALDVAAAAEYAGRTVDLAEEGAVERWFDRVPADRGLPVAAPTYRVRDEVRDYVRLARHNLVTDESPMSAGEADLIVCRNVTIYFARETTRALVERFHRALRPGGYLMLGHAETLWQVSDAFSLVPVGEAFVYRKDSVPLSYAEPSAAVRANGRHSGRARARAAVARTARPVGRRPDVEPPRAEASRRAADPLLSSVQARLGQVAADHAALPEAIAAVTAATVSPGAQLYGQACSASAAGHYARAAELAGHALRADPMLADAYVLRGQSWSTLGEDDKALDDLRKAVYLEPAAGHAHFLLAGALSRLGQPAAAARSFRAAAASLPRVSPETVHGLLDGRDVHELVALCEQLAEASERAATAASGSGRSTT
jgi:chemotaxis protein methyltransferase CheR